MSEVSQPTAELSELPAAEEIKQEAIAVERLAYEGLMRLVECGSLTKEQALQQHNLYFPNQSAK